MSDYGGAEQGETQAQGGSRGGLSGPRATLERLGDITITGKFAINLRILLEPIGFLRFITVVCIHVLNYL